MVSLGPFAIHISNHLEAPQLSCNSLVPCPDHTPCRNDYVWVGDFYWSEMLQLMHHIILLLSPEPPSQKNRISSTLSGIWLLLSTHSHDPYYWGESHLPTCGPPARRDAGIFLLKIWSKYSQWRSFNESKPFHALIVLGKTTVHTG